MKERFQTWLRQAEFDLQAAQLSNSQGFYEWACFQSVQALEKALKSVIVRAGERAPKTHKLAVLMGMCNDVAPEFVNVSIDFRQLETYTFIARYPFLIPGKSNSPHEFITEKDAAACLTVATDAIEKITNYFEIATLHKALPKLTKFSKDTVDFRIADLINILRQSKEFKLEQMMVFGSFARSFEQLEDKTMDLLVVAETDLPFFERIKTLRKLASGGKPIIEPLVYTPGEFTEMQTDGGESFLMSALEEAITVFPPRL